MKRQRKLTCLAAFHLFHTLPTAYISNDTLIGSSVGWQWPQSLIGCTAMMKSQCTDCSKVNKGWSFHVSCFSTSVSGYGQWNWTKSSLFTTTYLYSSKIPLPLLITLSSTLVGCGWSSTTIVFLIVGLWALFCTEHYWPNSFSGSHDSRNFQTLMWFCWTCCQCVTKQYHFILFFGGTLEPEAPVNSNSCQQGQLGRTH